MRIRKLLKTLDGGKSWSMVEEKSADVQKEGSQAGAVYDNKSIDLYNKSLIFGYRPE